MSATAPQHLLVFRFAGGRARFEGQIVGALERAESGGAITVVEALYAGRDGTSGDLEAVRVTGGAGGLIVALADFRLDPRRRQRLSAETLRGDADAAALREMGDALTPGEAVVAVLVEHTWHAMLLDAVERAGGRTVADAIAEAPHAEALTDQVVAAVAGRDR